MIESLSSFLVQHENVLLFLVLVLALMVSALIEATAPRRPQDRTQLKHRWPVNFSLLVFDQVSVTWIAAAAVVVANWWNEGEQMGLVASLNLGFMASTLLALLVFEFISYWFHRSLHAFPLLWRIHAIHHCDTEIDFSTTFRNHPLELLVIAPITVPVVLLLGFPPAAVVTYQLLRLTILVFAHSNMHIPQRLDRPLRWLITTPDYHRIHHSTERGFTDSNFSTVLPIYDYLFGTYRTRPHATLGSMPIGLDYLRDPADASLGKLLLAPFRFKRVVAETAVVLPRDPAQSSAR